MLARPGRVRREKLKAGYFFDCRCICRRCCVPSFSYVCLFVCLSVSPVYSFSVFALVVSFSVLSLFVSFFCFHDGVDWQALIFYACIPL